ncbi:MAG: ThiF family adenylyltransferase [Verrucomicrobiota bacterium]
MRNGEIGATRAGARAQRALTINPFCRVRALQSFFLRSTAAELLQGGFDYVLDAIDSPSRKALLIASCHERSIPVITVGASGGRLDPTAIEVADLAQSSHDRLLQEVRRKLRQRHGFPRGDVPFGIECVLSRERVAPLTEPFPDDGAKASRLDCAGRFGTAAFVTGTFGFVAAWRIIRSLGAGGTASETSVESSVLPGQ